MKKYTKHVIAVAVAALFAPPVVFAKGELRGGSSYEATLKNTGIAGLQSQK